MKGTVYGGVLYLPQHPAADIHGLVRACIRTRNWLWAEEHLAKQGVAWTHILWLSHLWEESRSAVEILVSQQHYGELLICPLVEAYIAPEQYKPYKKPSETAPAATTPTHQTAK